MSKLVVRHLVMVLAFVFAGTAGVSAASSSPPPGKAKDAPIWITSNAAARQFQLDGNKAFDSGQLPLAMTLYRKALAVAPKEARLRMILGRMFVLSGDYVSAERELRQARADGAPDNGTLSWLFRAMLPRHEEAQLLNEFHEPAPSATGDVAADILKGRAEAFLALGNLSAAASQMDRSLALRRDAMGLLARADIAAAQNDNATVNRLTDEALKVNPLSGHALTAKLNLLMRANDNRNALALSEHILKLYPDSPDIRLSRIEVLLRMNQIDNAQKAVDALLRNRPKDPGALYYSAVLLARRGDAAGAWRIAQSVPPTFTQSNPTYALTVAQLAVASGNVESGAAVLGAALAKFPSQTDVRLRLAELRLSQNSPLATIDLLQPVKDSEDPRVLDMLARSYLTLTKYPEASGILMKLQKKDSKHAETLLMAAIRLEPGAVELIDTLGWIQFQQKDVKEALVQLKRAHSLRPDDAAITFHLVQVLDASGDRNSAKTMLKALLDSGASFGDQEKARALSASWR